jgi:methionyl-tRNA formyltransferase
MTRAIVFAYSEVGLRCVRELLAQGVEIPLLFTHADDPAEQHWFGSVLELAKAHGLRTETASDPNTEAWVREGRRIAPDFLFSFYYRYMLCPAWLELPRRGALNMHGSLLPKFRGRAPVHWAIIEGESVTGASLHYMVAKPDAGDLVDQESVPILENDTALAVSLKVADAAERVLRRNLPLLLQGTSRARPLDLAAGSYFGRRRPEDGRIDWRQPARRVHDLVRAVAPPFPGAFTDVNGCRLQVLKTRLDAEPALHATAAPCLYAVDDAWYADCVDGRRLEILELAIERQLVAPGGAPAALPRGPVSLN